MKLLKLLFTATCLICAAWAGIAPADEHTTDSPQQIAENLKTKKGLLVDVREPAEQRQGYVRGAARIPLSQLEKGTANQKGANPEALQQFAATLAEQLPKDKILYTYCASGRRSVVAGKILSQMGYDVRPLKAGYQDLVAAGYPSTTSVSESPADSVKK